MKNALRIRATIDITDKISDRSGACRSNNSIQNCPMLLVKQATELAWDSAGKTDKITKAIIFE